MKLVKMTLSEGQILIYNFDFRGHISTFRAKNTTESWALKPKTMVKRLLNNSKATFKKPRKRVFWPWKWSKWPFQRPKFWAKILILEFIYMYIYIYIYIYRPLELKIHLKVELLKPKTMPKQLLNNSKPTFKMFRKQVFWPWKWSKWPSKRPKFWHTILILEDIYRPIELKIGQKVRLVRPKTMPKQLQTNFQKVQKMIFSSLKMVKNG